MRILEAMLMIIFRCLLNKKNGKDKIAELLYIDASVNYFELKEHEIHPTCQFIYVLNCCAKHYDAAAAHSRNLALDLLITQQIK